MLRGTRGATIMSCLKLMVNNCKRNSLFFIRHIRERHENPILNCPFCDYTSKYKQNLRRHIRVHHEAERYSGFQAFIYAFLTHTVHCVASGQS